MFIFFKTIECYTSSSKTLSTISNRIISNYRSNPSLRYNKQVSQKSESHSLSLANLLLNYTIKSSFDRLESFDSNVEGIITEKPVEFNNEILWKFTSPVTVEPIKEFDNLVSKFFIKSLVEKPFPLKVEIFLVFKTLLPGIIVDIDVIKEIDDKNPLALVYILKFKNKIN